MPNPTAVPSTVPTERDLELYEVVTLKSGGPQLTIVTIAKPLPGCVLIRACGFTDSQRLDITLRAKCFVRAK